MIKFVVTLPKITIDTEKALRAATFALWATMRQRIFFEGMKANGTPIAILLQYGHGTKNGGYVQGRDYINPALQPIFDEIADKCWKEVENL